VNCALRMGAGMNTLRIAGMAFTASLTLLVIVVWISLRHAFDWIPSFVMLPFRTFGLWLPAPKVQSDPIFEALYPLLFFGPPLIAINCFWWFIRELAKRYDSRIS